MDIIAAWAATVEAFNNVFAWKTGGRTKDENTLRSQIKEAERDYYDAIDHGDVDRLNRAHALLGRLRDEAAAKQP
mgnify:CR=1 FL=1